MRIATPKGHSDWANETILSSRVFKGKEGRRMLLALSQFHGARPKEMDAKKTVIDVDGLSWFGGDLSPAPFPLPLTSLLPLPLFHISIEIKYSLFFMSSAGKTNSMLRHCTSTYRTVRHADLQPGHQTSRVILCDSLMPRPSPKRNTTTMCPPPRVVLFSPFPLPDQTESRACGVYPAHTQDGEWGTPVALRISLVFGCLF